MMTSEVSFIEFNTDLRAAELREGLLGVGGVGSSSSCTLNVGVTLEDTLVFLTWNNNCSVKIPVNKDKKSSPQHNSTTTYQYNYS